MKQIKRVLFVLIGFATLIGSCQNDNSCGEMVAVTIMAAVGESEVSSRAFGDGSDANRCILEVYTEEGVLYTREVTAVNEYSAKFELYLNSANSYTFVAWADNVACVGELPTATELTVDHHYTTSNGLKTIEIADIATYASDDDTRDAFFANTKESVSASQTISMTLSRPFGQLNVLTDFNDGIVSFTPAAVRVEYSTELFTMFNASNGEVSSPQTIEWVNPMTFAEPYSYYNDHVILTTDYLLAPYTGDDDDKEIVINFEMEFYNADGELVTTNNKFDNIPVKRNYRTNVYGSSLPGSESVNVSISVIIDPAFDSDIDINIDAN